VKILIFLPLTSYLLPLFRDGREERDPVLEHYGMTGLGLAKNGTDMKRFVSPGFSPACGGALRNDSLTLFPSCRTPIRHLGLSSLSRFLTRNVNVETVIAL
jgi:hypothetical protein